MSNRTARLIARTSLISRLSAFSDAWRERPVRITTSARRRFSASGIWRAITAAMSASLIRRRARMRCICTCARRRHDDDAIDALIAAGLQQQRDVEHHGTSAPPPGARDEGTLLLPHHRVQDAPPAGSAPPDCPAPPDATPPGPPRRRAPCPGNAAAIARTARPPRACNPVHRGIRVEHRDARPAERRGGRRLPHADAAGQAEDDHRVSRSAATNWRSSSSTRGSTPNQAWKPGTA